jgi:hypothetical protein
MNSELLRALAEKGYWRCLHEGIVWGNRADRRKVKKMALREGWGGLR